MRHIITFLCAIVLEACGAAGSMEGESPFNKAPCTPLSKAEISDLNSIAYSSPDLESFQQVAGKHQTSISTIGTTYYWVVGGEYTWDGAQWNLSATDTTEMKFTHFQLEPGLIYEWEAREIGSFTSGRLVHENWNFTIYSSHRCCNDIFSNYSVALNDDWKITSSSQSGTVDNEESEKVSPFSREHHCAEYGKEITTVSLKTTAHKYSLIRASHSDTICFQDANAGTRLFVDDEARCASDAARVQAALPDLDILLRTAIF